MCAYKIIPHTAEVGLRVLGRSKGEMFRAAAQGLLSLYRPEGLPKGRPKSFSIYLEAETPEELLVAWLNEIIFLVSTKRLFPIQLRVARAELALAARLKVLPIKENTRLACEIKSATYHKLKVRQMRGAWAANVILDV